jgi:hypothetical protein
MVSLAKEENMPKLTDSQLIVLSKAAAREDGSAIAPTPDAFTFTMRYPVRQSLRS